MAALAALLGGCGEPEKAAQPAPKAEVKMAAEAERVERVVDGQRFGMTLNRVASPNVDVLMRLKAATTVNVDAPGVPTDLAPGGRLELRPAAADVLAKLPRTGEPPAEGIAVYANEIDATVSFDGYPPEKDVGAGLSGAQTGWFPARLRKLAAGVHAIKVEKPGFFPVETQVLIRPGVYEVLAVRLGKVVMKTDMK
jgi:hypothetical protein